MSYKLVDKHTLLSQLSQKDNHFKYVFFIGDFHPAQLEFIGDLLTSLTKRDYLVLLMDLNNLLTPQFFLNLSDDVIEHTYLFKVFSLSSFSKILHKLSFSRNLSKEFFELIGNKGELSKKSAIVIHTLFFQIPYRMTRIYQYDPLLILYELKNILHKTSFIKDIYIFINTMMPLDELGKLRLLSVIKDIATNIFHFSNSNNQLIFYQLK